MHEVDISPVAVHSIDINLPLVVGETTGAVVTCGLANAIARAPVVNAIRAALVPAPAAVGTRIAYSPNVTGSIGAGATIFAPFISAFAFATEPVINSGQTVTAVIAQSTSLAKAPIPVGVGDAAVVAVKPSATTDAKIPVVSGGISASVTAPIATASGAAIVPNIPLLSVTVTAVIAKTSVPAPAKATPPVVTGEFVLTGGGPGTGSAIAIPPSVGTANALQLIGSAVSATTSVAIPTHAVGDLIVIWAYNGNSNTAPTKPAAAGTVPAYVDIDNNVGVSTNASRTAQFVATATTTTSGIWAGATSMIAAVLHGQDINPIGGHAEAGATDGSNSVAPAVTLTRTDGSSSLLHFFGVPVTTTWGSAPVGYTTKANDTFSLLATKNSSAVDGSVTYSHSLLGSARYRGASIEVLSTIAHPAPTFVAPVGRLDFSAFTTTMSIPVPAGTAAGSVILACMLIAAPGTQTVTPPAGFTQALASPAIVSGTGASDFALRVYQKRVTAADTGTYDFGMSAGGAGEAVALRFVGCTASGALFGDFVTGVKTTNTDGNTPPVTITTAGDNRLSVWVSGGSGGGACTTLSGFTEIWDPQNANLVVDIRVEPVPTTVGPLVATWENPCTTAAWVGALLPG